MQEYEVIGTLGSGGFGDVYKVRHTVTGNIFALKTSKQSGTRLHAWVSEVKAM